MHLRSGAFYRTGISIGINTMSRASIHESIVRSQPCTTDPIEDSAHNSGIDTLSNIVTRDAYVDEVPPMLVQLNWRLINSVRITRVLIDDVNKALYMRRESESKVLLST